MKKPEPVHKTDEFLRGKGHDVLRLPHTIVNLTLSKWHGGMLWFYFVFNMNTKVSPLFWGYGFKSFYY
jgi:hypothetical protein